MASVFSPTDGFEDDAAILRIEGLHLPRSNERIHAGVQVRRLIRRRPAERGSLTQAREEFDDDVPVRLWLRRVVEC